MYLETYIEMHGELCSFIPDANEAEVRSFVEESGYESNDFVLNLTNFLWNPKNQNNKEFVSAAIYFYQTLGLPEKWPQLLGEVLLSSNHQEHTSIIELFNNEQDEACVSYIGAAIQLKSKLSSVPSGKTENFYKQCFAVLANIASDEALSLIKYFTTSENETIKRFALSHLPKDPESEHEHHTASGEKKGVPKLHGLHSFAEYFF